MSSLVKISDIIDVRDGTHDSPKYVSSGYPLITSKNLVNGKIILDTVNYISEADFININKRSKVENGDILYSMIGSIGNIAKVDQDPQFAIKNVALFKKSERIDNCYLFHLLKSNVVNSQIDIESKGGTQKFVSLGILRNLKIPLPLLSEQKRIAELLDAADSLRQKDKALLEKYDQLAQSLFLEMFGDPVKNEKGWEKIVISSFTTVSSGSTPSRENDDNFNGKIPWVKTGEVNGKRIITTEESISHNALEKSSCKLYPIDSVIVAMYGQGKTRGQIGILGIEATTNQACAVILPSERMNSNFLFNQLLLCYDDLRKLGRGGNQPNLNSGLIKNYMVLCPPISLQNQFAKQVQLIERQKELTKKNLEKSEELFGALMGEVFLNEKGYIDRV